MEKHICSSSTHRTGSSRPALATQCSRSVWDPAFPSKLKLRMTNQNLLFWTLSWGHTSRPGAVTLPYEGTPCQLGSWVLWSRDSHWQAILLLCCRTWPSALLHESCNQAEIFRVTMFSSHPINSGRTSCLNSRGTAGKADSAGLAVQWWQAHEWSAKVSHRSCPDFWRDMSRHTHTHNQITGLKDTISKPGLHSSLKSEVQGQ